MLFGFGKTKIPLKEQLEQLRLCGLFLNEGITEEDLFIFNSCGEMEANPYRHLVEALGFEAEREPYPAICDGLWMCDYERIENPDDYILIIERLMSMSRGRLKIENIGDLVDIEGEQAWVEFDFNGQRYHWDLEVDNDWLDPSVLVKFDGLLRESTDLAIYSNHSDYGQVAFLGCFTPEEFGIFQKLSKVKLRPLAEQA